MENFKDILIDRVTTRISEFDLECMYHREDGDAECEKLFGEDLMNDLDDDGFSDASCEDAKQRLIEKNQEVIKAFTECDEQFYRLLAQRLDDSPIYAVSEDQYIDHVVLDSMLFNIDGDLVLWGSP